jgi:hypothetical protein
MPVGICATILSEAGSSTSTELTPAWVKLDHLAVVAEFSIARRLIERQRANDAPRRQVDEGQRKVARFLPRDVRELAVSFVTL